MGDTQSRKVITYSIFVLLLIAVVLLGVLLFRMFISPVGGKRTINLADVHPNITGPKITGTIYDPDGKPAAGAEIRVGTQARQTVAYPVGGQADGISGAGGAFEIADPKSDYVLSIRSPIGYAEVSSQALAKGSRVQLQPWGRIEGVVKAGGTTLPHTDVSLWRVTMNQAPVSHQDRTTTDANGHFVFAQVAPGGTQLYRSLRDHRGRSADWRYVEALPGKTTTVDIGGPGFAVVGRLEVVPGAPDMGWTTKHGDYDASIRRDPNPIPLKHQPSETPEEYRAAEEAFGRTPEGKICKEWMFGSNFDVNTDGTFRIDNLSPGKYRMEVRSFELLKEVHFLEDVAHVSKTFEIPADTTTGPTTLASSPQPVDLGALTPTIVPRLRAGDVAPDFSITTADGKSFNSIDNKGKVIVLIFWGTWSNTDRLKPFGDFYAKWKADERVTIVGDYIAGDKAAADRIIKENKLDFPQSEDKGVMSKFHSSWPEAVMIGRDGKVVQKHLQGDTLEKYLKTALADTTAATTTSRVSSPASQP